MSASGYAARLNGEIDIKTACASPRGAKVNALCLYFNVWATMAWSDENINGAWTHEIDRLAVDKPDQRVEIVPVRVVDLGPLQ